MTHLEKSVRDYFDNYKGINICEHYTVALTFSFLFQGRNCDWDCHMVVLKQDDVQSQRSLDLKSEVRRDL